jgi:hypothetical protein
MCDLSPLPDDANQVLRPYTGRSIGVDNGRMSMYVNLLSSALDGRLEELSGAALVHYALDCRAAMLASEPHHGASAYTALAAEVAYDRALLKLCAAHDLVVHPTEFSHPKRARDHLERQLATCNVDLAVLAKHRTRVSG